MAFTPVLDFAALQMAGDLREIAQAGIRAASEEGDVDLGSLDRVSRTSDACERELPRRWLDPFRADSSGDGNLFVDEDCLAGIDPPCHRRADIGGLDR